jgi:hypothetical protein
MLDFAVKGRLKELATRQHKKSAAVATFPILAQVRPNLVGEAAPLLLLLFQYSLFIFTSIFGYRPSTKERRQHLSPPEGEVTKDIQLEHYNTIKPLRNLASKKRCILVTVLPRYAVARYCLSWVFKSQPPTGQLPSHSTSEFFDILTLNYVCNKRHDALFLCDFLRKILNVRKMKTHVWPSAYQCPFKF